jgi:hypothetical protein
MRAKDVALHAPVLVTAAPINSRQPRNPTLSPEHFHCSSMNEEHAAWCGAR